jgi:hypothetical protein
MDEQELILQPIAVEEPVIEVIQPRQKKQMSNNKKQVIVIRSN